MHRFEKFFQKYLQSVIQFGSRSGLTFKLFANPKIISRPDWKVKSKSAMLSYQAGLEVSILCEFSSTAILFVYQQQKLWQVLSICKGSPELLLLENAIHTKNLMCRAHMFTMDLQVEKKPESFCWLKAS